MTTTTAVVLALLEREGRWFLQRRSLTAAVLPGVWEFPGGKVTPGESLAAALRRELHEEISLKVQVQAAWPPLPGEPSLHPFLVRSSDRPITTLAWGWFTAREMLRLPIPPRNHSLILRLLSRGGDGASPAARAASLIT